MLLFSLYLMMTPIDENDPRCVAPLTHAPGKPTPDAQLLQYHLIIRHGNRSPAPDFFLKNDTNVYLCDVPSSISPRYNPAPVKHPRTYYDKYDPRIMAYKPSCAGKDLTTLGMKQEYELGQHFRQYLVEEEKFLPPIYNPDFILARTSECDRTVKSAIAFLQGMYPPVSPNEIIQLQTDTPSNGILHPKKEWCVEMQEKEKTFKKSKEYKELNEKYKNKYYEFLKDTYMPNGWEFNIFKKIESSLILTSCVNNRTIPSPFDEAYLNDTFIFLGEYYDKYFCQENISLVGSGPLLREIFKVTDEYIAQQNKIKFAYYSSHDTILATILTSFGYRIKTAIPTRSYIAFELWKVGRRIYGRFVYNGQPLIAPFLNQEFFLYSDLKMRLAENGYLHDCLNEYI